MPADYIFISLFLLINIALLYLIYKHNYFRGVRSWAVVIWVLMMPVIGFITFWLTVPFLSFFDLECGSIVRGSEGCQAVTAGLFGIMYIVYTGLPAAICAGLMHEKKAKMLHDNSQ